jgi:transcriptional antiterminator RfaH
MMSLNTITPSRSWAVVNTHPHREQLAVENLERQKFEVYAPKIIKRIRHARKSRDVARALFPGYVFLRVDADHRQWRPALSTYGVRTLMRNGTTLSLLPDAFIAGLRAREQEGLIVRPTNPFQVGQEVRISGGPFDGLIAEIVQLGEQQRLVVLLDVLNRPVRVQIEAHSLREVA